jgi:GT2 family glycosyltransferase/glycosyltransferase involved in cell wall biosynthesis
MDPIDHYLRHGGAEFRNPSLAFNTSFYCYANPDVHVSGINPLIHYLLKGRREGRQIRQNTPAAPAPVAPDERAWDELARDVQASGQASAQLDVVIPVYRGLDETANCIYSVLRSRLTVQVPFELVVIDDHSPEPALSDLLDRLAAKGLFTLLRNPSNAGFVVSVNRGMDLHQDRDVILLNSDTEVYNDWSDRLHRAAYAQDNIGTVTPFSNNATICGYPNFAGEFVGSFEVPFAEIDRLARDANAGEVVDLPTAIGFCMFIRRECIKEVGLFDAETFGLGYGEENDFCLRIAARGWRNVLTGDTFVRHLGRVPFTDSTQQRVQQALEIIDVLHPSYLPDVAAYLKNDPPQRMRRNLDFARLRHASGPRAVLFVLHNLEGGTPRHVDELSTLLAEEGVGSYLLRPWPGDNSFAELTHASVRDLSVVQRIDLKHDLPGAIATLRGLGVVHIHVHHFTGYAAAMIDFIEAVAEQSKITYDFTAHDYLAVCPRTTMIDRSGAYCDNRDLQVCERCVKADGAPAGDVSVWQWRRTYEQFLRGARKVFVPDEDVKARLKWFLPSIPITVRPHPESVPAQFAKPLIRQSNEILRVAVIGAIGPHKGSLQVQRCAEDAVRRRLPIKFVLFGYTDKREMFELPTVETTGRYNESDLPLLLERAGCHLSLFPAVWPETYSYTLSQAFYSGIYPVAFDIGAIARRIRAANWGMLLPFALRDQPRSINDALLACEVPPMPDTIAVAGRNAYGSIVGDYYEFDPTLFGVARTLDPVDAVAAAR